MATLDELNTAANNVATSVNALIEKATADQAAQPDFQAAVDTLNGVVAAVNAFLAPAAAEPAA